MHALRWTLMTTLRRVCCAAVVAALVLPGSFARAADDEDEAFDTRIIRSMLEALGLRRDDGSGIEYRERSPLVVPPSVALPPPETKSIADQNPNWPSDPDVRRAREAAVARAKAKPFDEIEDSRPLRPSELNPTGRGNPGPLLPWPKPEEPGKPMTPSALGYVGGLFSSLFAGQKEEYKAFTGEPPRTVLTAPPPGYQTPSPAQPYGVGKQRYQPKAANPMDRSTDEGN